MKEIPLALNRITSLLVDLDGVLYRGNAVLPGAVGLISWLREHGIGFRLVTNNSTLTPRLYVGKLRAMQIPIQEDEVFPSALATGLYMEREGARGQRAFVVGEEGVIDALQSIGVEVTDRDPQWVVAGLDRTLTYGKLATATLALRSGARFVGTNPDTSFPSEAGLVPGAGAIQALLTAATGMQPVVIGKPEPLMFDLAMTQLGGDRTTTAMLGDRLDTDIEGAAAFGLPSIMVLTGVSTRADLEGSAVQPSLVVEGLPELMDLWGEALRR